MAEPKTQLTKASVKKFLSLIKDKQKREDCALISNVMTKASKSKPEMWGESIVGFGRRKQTYANGKVSEWMKIGFAPRKQNIALYGLKKISITREGVKEKKGDNHELPKLGKYKEGGGCVYINKVSDIDTKQLEKIIKLSLSRQA